MYQPRTDGNTRSEEKGMEQSLPHILQGQRGPANTMISDFSLQDCERLIKATQFVLLVPAALGNKCTYKNYMVFV